MSERLLTVTKALRVIQLLSSEGPLALGEVSERVGLSKTVTHRALMTLHDEGWVVQDPGTRKYQLGLRMWEVGMGGLHHLPIYNVSLPFIERLASEQKETAGLVAYEGGDMLFLTHFAVMGDTTVSAITGTRALPHTTSGGKVALAFLPDVGEEMSRKRSLPGVSPLTITSGAELRRELEEVRRQGYAVNRGGRDARSCGVAAPIFNRAGSYAASVYASCPTARFTDEWLSRLTPAVVDCAAQISAALGHQPSRRTPGGPFG